MEVLIFFGLFENLNNSINNKKKARVKIDTIGQD